MEQIKVVIVDDHTIVREGLVALLDISKNIVVTGEAGDATELFNLLSKRKPDIILLDINLPGITGVEIAQILCRDYPTIKVIILSADYNQELIFNTIEAGAKGYIPKKAASTELIQAIETVFSGDEYFNQLITNAMFKSYIASLKENKKPCPPSSEALLSEREKEIVKLFATGYSYKEIAAKLYISARTVESHKNNIMDKMGFKTKVDLIKYAIKNKIIEI
jgi:DNA-binding NarL/FixJ family response regulator